MAANDFLTVPDELLHVAAAAETHFGDEGFEVKIEYRDFGFPFTPTLVCHRNHETVIVEVSSSIETQRIDRWLSYCRSQTVDTRLFLVLRNLTGMDPRSAAYAANNRLGLAIHNDEELVVIRPAADLAIHVALPDIRTLPASIRPTLAPAFQKVRDGDWRDGLFHAYTEVEQHARAYLVEEVATGRSLITKTHKKNIVQVTAAEVERMTLGQLKDAFKKIQKQTQKDAWIGGALEQINRARVGLTHRRRSAAVEAELRNQVGQHMHIAIAYFETIAI